MLKNPLVWLGGFLLIALAAIWDFSPEDLMHAPEQEAHTYPQAYLVDSRTRRFNPQGQLRYRLDSTRADHFQYSDNGPSDQDYSIILQPKVGFHDPDGPPWYLNAEQGQSNADGSRIRLWEDVQAWQSVEGGRSELLTEELIIFPNRQFAETDKAVKMRSPQGETDAVGMRANLERDHIELLSEVRGTYTSNRGKDHD